MGARIRGQPSRRPALQAHPVEVAFPNAVFRCREIDDPLGFIQTIQLGHHPGSPGDPADQTAIQVVPVQMPEAVAFRSPDEFPPLAERVQHVVHIDPAGILFGQDHLPGCRRREHSDQLQTVLPPVELLHEQVQRIGRPGHPRQIHVRHATHRQLAEFAVVEAIVEERRHGIGAAGLGVLLERDDGMLRQPVHERIFRHAGLIETQDRQGTRIGRPPVALRERELFLVDPVHHTVRRHATAVGRRGHLPARFAEEDPEIVVPDKRYFRAVRAVTDLGLRLRSDRPPADRAAQQLGLIDVPAEQEECPVSTGREGHPRYRSLRLRLSGEVRQARQLLDQLLRVHRQPAFAGERINRLVHAAAGIRIFDTADEFKTVGPPDRIFNHAGQEGRVVVDLPDGDGPESGGPGPGRQSDSHHPHNDRHGNRTVPTVRHPVASPRRVEGELPPQMRLKSATVVLSPRNAPLPMVTASPSTQLRPTAL